MVNRFNPNFDLGRIYPLNSSNPLLYYSVPVGNYLVDVANVYYAIQGEIQPDQPNPAALGYTIPHIPSRLHILDKGPSL